MADREQPDDGPSLEMPSFSLRRRRRAGGPAEPEPRPAAEAEPEPRPAAEAEPEPRPAAEAEPEPETVSEPEPTVTLSPAAADGAGATAPQPRPVRRPPEVHLPGVVSAVATGVLVGLAAALLGWALGAGCEAVRGTSACGGTIGFPALLASLVLLAWAGGLLLRVLGVPDAGSTSTLAVAVGAVVVLVGLLGALDEWWVVLALPATGALAYAASWWVTTVVATTDTDAGIGQPHDVR